MWVSDDDLWEPQFIAANLQQLEKFPDAQMSFCSIDSINRSGHVIRTLGGFSRFKSTGNRRADIVPYMPSAQAHTLYFREARCPGEREVP